MARQEINIGIEGNDGTGDSIRQSFSKVNENFIELYAVFGVGGQIRFTSLSDTPDILTENTVAFSDGNNIVLAELVSNSAIDPESQDSIAFSYDIPGKIVISNAFSKLSDDLSPTLGGPINAAGKAIANVGISQAAANEVNALHGSLTDITIDDLVITKRFADQRYLTADTPIRLPEQPSGVLHFSWRINDYVSDSVEILSYYTTDQQEVLNGHGLDASYNGTGFKFFAEDTAPGSLVSGEIYYIRVVSSTRLWLYTEENKSYSTALSEADADLYNIPIGNADIDINDRHTLTISSYNENLTGNFLEDQPVPRSEVVLRSGDTITGPMYLNDHPGEFEGFTSDDPEDLRVATKFYVDNQAYSSPEVLFVSTVGDDSMQNAPAGKEGSSSTYSYRTINAAAKKAEELIKSAGATPGPYMQTLTNTIGGVVTEALVMDSRIDNATYSTARNLLLENKEFIQKEVIGYIGKTYPNFAYDVDYCQRDIGLLVDAIAFDVNRGVYANYLTRQAAERYYSSVSAKKAITAQLTETKEAFLFAKNLSDSLLQNKIYRQKNISNISLASPAVVTTQFNHEFADGDIVFIKDVAGMTEINNSTAYVKTFETTTDTFELFVDENFTIPFDTTGFSGYTSSGVVGQRFQETEKQYFESGTINISSISQTLPVVVTSLDPHFLSANEDVLISGVNGMTEVNGTFNVRPISSTEFQLFTAEFQYPAPEITNIDLGTTPITITTNGNHNLTTGDTITLVEIQGSTELNNTSYGVDVLSTTEFQLYTDSSLTIAITSAGVSAYISGGTVLDNAVDGTGFSLYTNGGIATKSAEANQTARNSISEKWELIDNIITNGIDAGSSIVYGNTYTIVIANQNQGHLDQTISSNIDLLPGKVIRGKRSEAIGRITKVENNVLAEGKLFSVTGINETVPTIVEVHLLAGKDFSIGEALEFGNFITKKEVVIRVEAGLYEEDFPIRLMNNVSLKGDEFRRVIIQPRTETKSNIPRVSQSKWASTYFFRDNYFDGLEINRGGSPFINQVGEEQGKFGYHYLYNPNKAINVNGGIQITNPGKFNNASDIILQNRDYIAKETLQYINTKYPTLIYDEEKCERDTKLIIEAISHDLKYGGENKILETQGSYHEIGYTDYLTQLGDSTQEVITEAAIDNIKGLTDQLLAGTEPDFDIVEAFYTTTDVSWDRLTGIAELTIGSHTLELGDVIKINNNSIIFTTINPDPVSFPSESDDPYNSLLTIIGKTATTITVNFGTSIYDHTFSSATTNNVKYIIYSAGSTDVTDLEKPIILLDEDRNPVQGESGTISIVQQFIDKINFVFSVDYNPPLRNDQMDMFLLGDATIVRNVTCKGHGGFMCVLDPDGQVLTKSPYIQTASSFSKSINQKTFSGGMYVDAFVGNLPTTIIDIDYTSGVSGGSGYLILNVQSEEGQGLRLRAPQLPCPFYVEGRRYQVNAISNYDSSLGTATIYLDANSNQGDGYDPTQFSDYNPADISRNIFLQTAGNRSILGNDYTQVNDLGYGLVCNNAAFSEMVSMFTYYCHAAYYASNGSEIRSLNGSNGYGNFGLVSEGADPNEIPDQVLLELPMVMSLEAYTTGAYTNAQGDSSIVVTNAFRIPLSQSAIQIDHGGSIGTLNYIVSTVSNLTVLDGVSSGGTFTTVYRLELRSDEVIQDDYYGELQDNVLNGVRIRYRDRFNLIVNGVTDRNRLQTRPSTALNFDESDDVTYRSIDFDNYDPFGTILPNDQTKITSDISFDYVELNTSITNMTAGFGSSQFDTKLAIDPLSGGSTAYPDNQRVLSDGGKIFAWDGRTHSIDNYWQIYQLDGVTIVGANYNDSIDSGTGATAKVAKVVGITLYMFNVVGEWPENGTVTGPSYSSSYTGTAVESNWAFIEFSDVAGTDITGLGTAGLSSGVPTSDQLTLHAGNPEGASAEITIAISLLRASGHDFTQIGTGSYNDSNYPNVILGDPINPLADFWTSAPVATSSQVWERRKGRVFWVSTDQYGFFRVGKFFNVDQATGAITFSGEIGISNANALGFKKGVTIDEFSPDDSFVDNSGTAVPTEKATGGYINKVLGFTVNAGSPTQLLPADGRIGPGFLPLNGDSPMEGALNLNSFKIENLANPANGTDAVNKNYVDGNQEAFSSLDKARDFSYWLDVSNNEILPSANQLIVSTGNKIIYTDIESAGTFSVGDTIRETQDPILSTKTGTIVQIRTVFDELFDKNVRKIVYTPVTGVFDLDVDATIYTGPSVTPNYASSIQNLGIPGVGGPYNEITYAKVSTTSDIGITVSKIKSEATVNLTINSLAIENGDVSATAGILQSKLSLNSATVKTTSVGLTQSDLGVAAFLDTEFSATNGLISLKDGTATDGIDPTKLKFIGNNTAIGRTDAGSGPASTITFAAIVSAGAGLVHSDFGTYTSGTDVLTRTGVDTYGVVTLSTTSTNSSVAQRTATGQLHANGLIIGSDPTYEILSPKPTASTTLQLKTPGQRIVLEISGASSSLSTAQFLDSINVGQASVDPTSISPINSEGLAQQGTNRSGFGFTATNWVYTKAIEAIDEGRSTANGTGIVFGADTGFTESQAQTMLFFANGNSQVIINDGALIPVADATDVNSKNLGSSSFKWNTVYAQTFSGTATQAQYADLAENYLADNYYEEGTVLVFGGNDEITITNSKGDKRVAGVVSTNPAHLMNTSLEGEYVTPLALQGRVPCKVLGKVAKGDMLVTSAIPGYAIVDNDPRIGTVLGKAVGEKTDDGKGVVEIVVGRV